MLSIYLMCLFYVVSSTLQDDRRIPPYFVKKNNVRSHIGNSNQQHILKCYAQGIPEPTISWQRNGKMVTSDTYIEDDGEGVLSINYMNEDTKGNYTCLAQNKYGTAFSEEWEVKQAKLVESFFPNQHKSVVEGKSVCLTTFEMKSVPPTTVIWYKLPDNTPETNEFSLNERTYIDTQGRLWFGYTLKEDSSFYELYKGKCKNIIFDKSLSCGVYNLTVSDAPSGRPTVIEASLIHSTPSTHVTLENKTMILECFIPSRPFENVKWSRENRKPLSDRSETDEWGYRVTVRNVRPEDAGEYVCQSGKVSHTIKVLVEAAPVFHNSPQDLNVTEGFDVVINCSNHALPLASVEWFINNNKIKKNEAKSRISISDDSQTLLIRNICRDCSDSRPTDSMVVQCRAKNKHGHIFSSSYINVLKKTVVKLVTGEREYVKETGYEAEVIVLNCSAVSDPLTPVLPRWYKVMKKNHKELLSSDSENMFVNGGLLIFNLNDTTSKSWQQYHGEYACIADNHYSNSAVHSKIIVKGISPVVASIMNFWWIIVIAGIVLLIFIIAIMVQCLYNVGDSYNVNKNEVKNGNNPIKEIEEKDFKIYSRPEAVDFKGSQATLLSKSSRDLSENGFDGYPGRYMDINEDGSFLGVYTGERQRSFNELA